MIKVRRVASRSAVLAAVLAGLTFGPAVPALADQTTGYSHDSSIGLTSTDWMARLPNSTLLSEISIPGTHDSGASLSGGDIALTQSMDLVTQLKSGIRAWDIRLGDSSGRLVVYHGIARQGQDFQNDVLGAADAFLKAHPTEVILMRVAQEQPASDFAGRVHSYASADPRVYRGLSDNPPLSEIRGKIVILQDFPSPTREGIPWANSGWSVQDDYNMSNNWDLARKWRGVAAQMDAASSGPAAKFYVNFLSASGGSFPYFAASGHSSPGTGAPNLLTGWTRGIINSCSWSANCIKEYSSVNCFLGTCSVAFQGVNMLATQKINEAQSVHHRYGIVYADFPGAGLIQSVINSNAGPVTTTS
ncbi:phosphatidylinositol-specific phospholipase C [Streptomyces sp. NBC_01264]|uniref:phosphatidylinositol-specific phospholipase C n=1 Tax=Streptomyces sp. NBC_01264 TaxID=2903804 RepID=UPI00224F39F4|nr:phosphatidylinositol-specific phospholipase C [Streptomyces sp. NBC_01264]MCX4781650.1 phosphatidylinositol-specific phospholipase C [Streptomyces sp. NBC_01264]